MGKTAKVELYISAILKNEEPENSRLAYEIHNRTVRLVGALPFDTKGPLSYSDLAHKGMLIRSTLHYLVFGRGK
jgi:hypothetical protein